MKTGGIDAEYGGALGGVISAVTKSGGNAFHGDLHYYLSGNGLSAAPVQRLVAGPGYRERTAMHIQDTKQTDNQHEIGGSLGGYFIKNKLYFFTRVLAAFPPPVPAPTSSATAPRSAQLRPRRHVPPVVQQALLGPGEPRPHELQLAVVAHQAERLHSRARSPRRRTPPRCRSRRCDLDPGQRLLPAAIELHRAGGYQRHQHLAADHPRRPVLGQLQVHRPPEHHSDHLPELGHQPAIRHSGRICGSRVGYANIARQPMQRLRHRDPHVHPDRFQQVRQLPRPAQPQGRLGLHQDRQPHERP